MSQVVMFPARIYDGSLYIKWSYPSKVINHVARMRFLVELALIR